MVFFYFENTSVKKEVNDYIENVFNLKDIKTLTRLNDSIFDEDHVRIGEFIEKFPEVIFNNCPNSTPKNGEQNA